MGAELSTMKYKIGQDQYHSHRLKATEAIFKVLKYSSKNDIQRQLCSFMRHYTRNQSCPHLPVAPEFGNSFSTAYEVLVIAGIKRRYDRLTKALGFPDYRTITHSLLLPQERPHSQEISQAITREFRKLSTRMKDVERGAEERDFEMLRAAEKILTLGYRLWEDNQDMIERKTLVVNLFKVGAIRRISRRERTKVIAYLLIVR